MLFDFGVVSDNGILPEETELSERMNALGLPLSFHTNKEVGLHDFYCVMVIVFYISFDAFECG